MDWAEFRAEFPVTERWAFFDHAAVAPLPRRAVAAMNAYAEDVAHNGIATILTWVQRLAHVRALAARLINAPNTEDILFIPNTTLGIGLIAEGFPWQPGDNVVLPAEEYPSNLYPWMNLANRGVEVRTVPSRGSRIEIDDIAAAITPRTRLLSISAVEFASGFRNDLDLLGELCRSRGIFFFVDAIQSLGAFPIDVQKSGIDALAADGHKWMLAPEGAGFGYIRREWVESLHPIGVGAHSVLNPFEYHVTDFRLKPHAGRWEGGALNVPGLSALGASLELFEEFGHANTAARILELTDTLCDRAPSRGWSVFSDRTGNARSGIVALTHPTIPPKVAMKACRDSGVIVNQRANRLRVSPHAYNTPDEIDRLLAALPQ